jgi:septal ring factor EnvC (AmiA/AmiB activator)
MPTEWRIRPEISRRRRFAAAPASLIVTMAIALLVGWQATSADPWRFLSATDPPARVDQAQASVPTDESMRSDLEQVRSEIVGLQQEIQDLNDQVRQKAAANVSANEQLQNFAGQLATEQRKSYTAIEQRDTVVRQMAALRSNLELACKSLRDRGGAQAGRSSPVFVAACGVSGP